MDRFTMSVEYFIWETNKMNKNEAEKVIRIISQECLATSLLRQSLGTENSSWMTFLLSKITEFRLRSTKSTSWGFSNVALMLEIIFYLISCLR